MVQLSVLDLVPVRIGQSSTQALAASIALAQVADKAGYTRYWVGEHHNLPHIAATSPAAFVPIIASATEQIIVGSGGVMLPNHSPLSVAEQFALIEAVFPGRIDLGIGRAPGGDHHTSFLLRGSRADEGVENFPQWIDQVIAMMNPEGWQIPKVCVKATPQACSAPVVWLLGSSDYSARIAALKGLPFAFAHHFTGRGAAEALQIYRSLWNGDHAVAFDRPRDFITVNVVVGGDDEEAKRLARPYQIVSYSMRTKRMKNPLLSVEEAQNYPADPDELEALSSAWLIGGVEKVAEEIFELADRYSLSEVMIHPVAGAYADESYGHIAARENTLTQLAQVVASTD